MKPIERKSGTIRFYFKARSKASIVVSPIAEVS